jgi:hypothetical protein|tara:strand:+ start:53 stop:301 length:249 start_codon:yes stop_codon:yes gene_type:complete
MQTTPDHADAMSREAAKEMRHKFYDHLSRKILANELPDMKHREVTALADFVEGRMVELMFPFLDGGTLPSWMLPSNSKKDQK